jgi:hypothetical protein
MGAETAGPREVEADVLECPRLDIQHGELEIPPGALLSHSNHLNQLERLAADENDRK